MWLIFSKDFEYHLAMCQVSGVYLSILPKINDINLRKLVIYLAVHVFFAYRKESGPFLHAKS
jgi:hypothetical protein